MTQESKKQDFTFQAEVKQLLNLLTHSLYQSREIAVRELISNASDALDKMRHLSLTDEKYRGEDELAITIERDEEKQQLVIADNGIGMTHDELIANLGTIAHSGSLEFLENAAKDESGQVSLIGQFGVGFYSAFMIADTVTVFTRSFSEEKGWQWDSDGTGSFSIQEAEGLERGTRIVLHLKDEVKDYANDYRINGIITKYSSFIPHPITSGDSVINEQKAIWVEPESQLDDEQYTQFYQHLTHRTGETPLFHKHLSIDSPIQFHALLYCPETNMEMLGFGRMEHGMNLCVRRILVQHDCRDIVPEYMRFLSGVVDSEDLPLNVSRETLQDNTVFRKIRTTLVRTVFDELDRIAEDEPEKYAKFYQQFGRMLKEGAHRDFANQKRIAGLLRFVSSQHESPDDATSLAGYISRCDERQKQIYYLGGPDLASVKNSPNLEIFRSRGLEVLFMIDPVDEFVMSALGTYEDYKLVSINSAELELPEVEKSDESEDASDEEKAEAATPDGFERVLELFKSALGEKIDSVRASTRLTDSPCCLVSAEGGMSAHVQKMLKMADNSFVSEKPILEINPASAMIVRLCSLDAANDAFIQDCGRQLYANALILDGVLPDPQELACRVQGFMEQALESKLEE